MSAQESSNEEKGLPYPCTVEQLKAAGTWHFRVRFLVNFAHDLTAPQRYLLRYILDGVNFREWNDLYREIATYAEDTGMDPKTVSKHRKVLAGKDYIHLEERSFTSSLVAVRPEKFVQLSERAAVIIAEREAEKEAKRNARKGWDAVTSPHTKNGDTHTKNGMPRQPKNGTPPHPKNGVRPHTKNGMETESPGTEPSLTEPISSEPLTRARATGNHNDSDDDSTLETTTENSTPSTDRETPSVKREDDLKQNPPQHTKNGMRDDLGDGLLRAAPGTFDFKKVAREVAEAKTVAAYDAGDFFDADEVA